MEDYSYLNPRFLEVVVNHISFDVPKGATYIPPFMGFIDLGRFNKTPDDFAVELFNADMEEGKAIQNADIASLFLRQKGFILADASSERPFIILTEKVPTFSQYNKLEELIATFKGSVDIITPTAVKTYSDWTSQILLRIIRHYYETGELVDISYIRKPKTFKGKLTFTEKQLDVTDPCYKRDVWCRSTVEIEPGEYTYSATTVYRDNWGRRVSSLTIKKADCTKPTKRGKCVCTIGVDAGMAGFFENKPDYDSKTWSKLCDDFFPHDCGTIFEAHKNNLMGCEGIGSDSGYGDGTYPVFEILDADGKRCGYTLKYL